MARRTRTRIRAGSGYGRSAGALPVLGLAIVFTCFLSLALVVFRMPEHVNTSLLGSHQTFVPADGSEHVDVHQHEHEADYEAIATRLPPLMRQPDSVEISAVSGRVRRLVPANPPRPPESSSSDSQALLFPVAGLKAGGYQAAPQQPSAPRTRAPVPSKPQSALSAPPSVPASTPPSAPKSGYDFKPNMDMPDVDLRHAETKSVEALKRACDEDPKCAGFNSNGWLKMSVAYPRAEPSTNLYIKRQFDHSQPPVIPGLTERMQVKQVPSSYHSTIKPADVKPFVPGEGTRQPRSKYDSLVPNLAALYAKEFGDTPVEISTGEMRNFLVLPFGAKQCKHPGDCTVDCDVPCHIFESRKVEKNTDCQIFGYCGGGFQHRADPHAYNKPPTQTWAIFQAEKASHCPNDVGSAHFMSKYDFIMSFHGNADVFMPAWEPHLGFIIESPERILNLPTPGQWTSPEGALASFVQGSCSTPAKREDYVKELMTHIKIHAPGPCHHNYEAPADKRALPGDDIQTKYEKKRAFVSQYKFNIAMENANENDWVTEKIFSAFIANSVPIYRGAPNIYEFVPKHSTINAAEFKSTADLAQYLRYLDANDTAYQEYFAWKKDPAAQMRVEEMFRVGQRKQLQCRLCRLVAQHKLSLRDPSLRLPSSPRIIKTDGIHSA